MKAIKFTEPLGTISGHCKLEIYQGDIRTPENLLETQEYTNLVTTVGKNTILDRLFALGSILQVTQIGVGTSATAAAIGDTTLTGSAFKVFDALPIRTAQTVACITTFLTTDANLNWQEIAMQTTAGVLFNRIAPIGPINKTAALSVTVTISISQG